MKNSERFKSLVNELLKESSKYQNELSNFMKYLEDRMLEEKVFNLNVNHIDEYFVYSYDTKIGAVPTLTSHISALKSLFDYLISKDINFRSLYAYIDTAGFKDKLSKHLEKSFKKPVIDSTLLKSTLHRIDTHIFKNINKEFKLSSSRKRFFEILIARLYAKLSLIVPLKPKEMLSIKIGNIKDETVRTLKHNDITIKIPNNLRNQIIETIDFADREFKKTYSENDKLFHFLYGVFGKKAVTSLVSTSFTKTYNELGISEMLKQKPGGKKDKYVYPPESYKITAILSMLNNGTNIVYLKKLTGLDMGTLVSNFDFDKDIEYKDVVSLEINRGIVSTDYYTYL